MSVTTPDGSHGVVPISRVLGGLRSTLNNDRASPAAKARARRRIAELEAAPPEQTHVQSTRRGKPRSPIYDEEELDVPPPDDHRYVRPQRDEETDVEHLHRVIGGYRSTLNNKHAGEVAKEHAAAMIAKLLPRDVKPVKPPTKAHVTHNEHHPVQPPPPDQPSLVYTKDQTESYQEHVNRVIGGHLSVLKSERTSEVAKTRSRDVLINHYGFDVDSV